MKSHLVLKNSTHRNSADEKNIRKVKDMNSKNCMHEITESAKTVRVVWGFLKTSSMANSILKIPTRGAVSKLRSSP